MTRSITTAAVMYAVTVSNAPAQAARPNFTGVWVLDVSNSESSARMPSAATWTITQHGDTVVSDRETTIEGAGAITSHVVIGIDGKLWKNTVSQPGMGEIETSTVASWDNGVLVIATSGNVQGTDFVQTDRWTLSAGGKSIVARRSVVVEGQEVQSATFTLARKS